ncbi:putative NAD(P)H dehydrogenase (quinone) FQR1-like 2 [Smittium culicis]|uniref:Putative NAD(P)H dehydrogenase (Quinone) FQR1-like 2 n=1 Tax=Smittium culicis TaxID=133412 RepID=A0A1R1XG66_9FUNG|nr:putative NAD(P)H dehydrogenase (quinone) FQR1-like 2 [Smittium culicis]
MKLFKRIKNAIRGKDKKTQAQTQVDQNKAETIEQNHSQTVDQNKAETIEQNHSQTIEQNKAETIEQNHSQAVEQNHSQAVEQNHSQAVEQNISQEVEQNHSQAVEQDHTQAVEQDHNQAVEQDHTQAVEQDHNQAVEQDHNQAVKQEHTQAVEQDHTQAVEQDHTQAVEQDHNQAVEQDHNQAVEQDHNQAVEQDHTQAVEQDHTQAVEQDHNQAVEQDHNQDVEHDHTQAVEQDHTQAVEQNHAQNDEQNQTEIAKKSLPTVFVVYYSTYGHLRAVADNVVKGLKSTGLVNVELRQFEETLKQEVLDKMHAPPKDKSVPIFTLEEFEHGDSFMFGFPTRFGTPPTQVKTFIDSTGALWFKKALVGKMIGLFTGTGDQSGGQESTAFTFLPNLIHQGMLYVPLGFTHENLFAVDEVVGGSAYGSGSIASITGARAVSEKEIAIAIHHGQSFAKTVSRYLN